MMQTHTVLWLEAVTQKGKGIEGGDEGRVTGARVAEKSSARVGVTDEKSYHLHPELQR